MTSPAWRHALVASLLLGACTGAGDGLLVAGEAAAVPVESATTVVTATTSTTVPSTTTTAIEETTTTSAGPTATTTTTTTTTVDLSGLDDALDELAGLLDELNTIESEGELP